MAVTSNTYTVGGSGQAGPYSYGFPIIDATDVKVSVDGVVKTVTTHYTTDTANTRITFVSGQEPSTGQKVIVYRDTDEDPINATFVSGSTIRSNELNDNFKQLLYIAQESDNQSLSKLGGEMEGDLGLGLKNNLYFEGATDNAYETTLTVVDPTADRTITLPNVTGTVVTTGDTGTVATAMIANDAVNGTKIANSSIDSEHYASASIDTAHIGNAQITTDKIADTNVTTAKIANGAVTPTQLANNAVERDKILNDAVNGSKIADDSIDSEHYVNGSIDSAHIANSAVTATQLANNAVERGKILDDAVNGSKIADDSINSEHYVDQSIDAQHIANATITATQIQNATITATQIANNAIERDKILNDAVNGSKIADDSIASEHYIDGSIDSQHVANNAITATQLANNAVERGKILNDAVNGSKIADDSIDSEHYVDGSIDTQHIATNAITATQVANNAIERGKILDDAVNGSKIADDSIDSEHYVDGSIDQAHLAANSVGTSQLKNDSVTADIIADNGVQTTHIADAELRTLAGATSGTASIIGDGTKTLTADIDELNMLDGKSVVTSISGSATDVQLPTAQAVNERVVELVTEVGGFVPIANETSFPSTNPDINDGAGTIVSIKALSSAIVCGSGVTTKTIANGAGSGNTVTINGLAQNTTYPAGRGMLVETTSTLHTYTYHRLTLDESGVADAQTAINDFNARYRILASGTNINTVGSLDDGDLLWDSNADKMKVYDATASAWKEVTSTGDFKYLFLCPAGGTGSPSFPGATYDLREDSNSGSVASVTNAAQLIVSVNGVIQKANTGTSAPSEGFALVDSNTIIFGANLVSTDSIFIVQVGSAVSIPTPGDNTVSTIKIQNLAVDVSKLAANAVTNVKIADDTIAEAKLDIHQAPADGKFLKYTSANGMEWGDAADTDKIEELNTSVECVDSGTDGKVKFTIDGTELARIDGALYLGESIPLRLGAIGTQDNTLEFIGSSSSTYHTFRSNSKDVQIEAKGVNNNSNTVHDWIKLVHSPGAGTTATKVELYASDVKRLETTTTGVTVIGTLTADLADNSIDSEHYVDGSIDNAHLADDAVNSDEIADGAVDLAHLSASGTKSSSTFLRGDNTWASAGGVSTGETYVKLSDANGTANNSGQVTSGGSGAGTQGNESTYYGYQAGGNSTGGGNTIIGGKAGDSMGAGGSNTALGQDALKSCNSANFNTALGKSALQSCTVSNNTAVGARAGDAATLANDCIFIGWDAGGGITEGDYNIAIGNECLMAATTGTANVNVGRDGLRAITSGSKNVNVGNDGNRTCTTGNFNVSVGHEALFNNEVSDQIGIGYRALKAFTTGTGRNTAVGHKGLFLCTGHQNTTLGFLAGNQVGAGSRNTLLGHESGQATNIGNDNTIVGYNAAYKNTEGNENVAVGNTAMYENGTGDENTAIGGRAMYGSSANSESFKNVCVGYEAGEDLSTGSYNTYVGSQSAHEATTSMNNVAIGINAGGTLTTGANNIFIGHESGYNQTSTGDNTFYIARGATGHGATAVWLSGDSSGNVYRTGGGTAFTSTSDERIKKNITDNNEGLSLIKQLRVRNFEWRTEAEIDRTAFGGSVNDPKYTKEEAAKLDSVSEGEYKKRYGLDIPGTHVGLIAQELEAVKANWVNTTEEGKKTIDPSELTWVLVNAVKELSTKNDALEARIAALEAK